MLYPIQYCTVYLSCFHDACMHISLSSAQGDTGSTQAYREDTVPQTHILLEVQNIH